MKISSHLIVTSLQSASSANTLLLGTVLSGALLITGCQSTPLSQNQLAKNNTINTNQTPMAAKKALANALQQQRRQSFAYHTNIEMSHQRQFADVDSRSLLVADEVSAHCETVHDKGYIDLLAQAVAQNQDILAPAYDAPRRSLKQSYLDCDEAYEAWATNKYNHEYGADDDDSNDDYAIQSGDTTSHDKAYNTATLVSPTTEKHGNAGATIIETSRMKGGAIITQNAAKNTAYVPPSYQQLFDDYEVKLSALDIKKAQLLDAYLLKPLSINAQGIYQPMAGKATLLGSVQYDMRNHKTNISQPIYIDFKTGSIYFWADNLAMLTSEMLDDKLGTQWQNKWLKLDINDGSLPKGFGRAIIKSHFEALDSSYERAPVSEFDTIAPNALMALSPKLPAHQLTPMLQSKQIIRRIQSPKSHQQFYQDYMTHLYERIITQYPELIDKDLTVDGESLAAIITSGEPLTTKALMTQILAAMQTAIAANTQTDIEKGVVNENSTSNGITSALASRGTIQKLYGLNHRGQIQWQHLRQQETDNQTLATGLTTDVLQQYNPMSVQMLAFPNLPATMQIPNASNSVDMREYSKALSQYYRDGNGPTIGKTLFNMLPNISPATVDIVE